MSTGTARLYLAALDLWASGVPGQLTVITDDVGHSQGDGHWKVWTRSVFWSPGLRKGRSRNTDEVASGLHVLWNATYLKDAGMSDKATSGQHRSQLTDQTDAVRSTLRNFLAVQDTPDTPELNALTETFTELFTGAEQRTGPTTAAYTAAWLRGPNRTGVSRKKHKKYDRNRVAAAQSHIGKTSAPPCPTDLANGEHGNQVASVTGAIVGTNPPCLYLKSQTTSTVRLPAELCLLIQAAWPVWTRLAGTGVQDLTGLRFEDQHGQHLWEWTVRCSPANNRAEVIQQRLENGDVANHGWRRVNGHGRVTLDLSLCGEVADTFTQALHTLCRHSLMRVLTD